MPRACAALVLPVFFLEMVGAQLLRAIIPAMESEFFGDASFSVSGNAFAVQGAITLLSAPVYGALSDCYGPSQPSTMNVTRVLHVALPHRATCSARVARRASG